MASPLAPNNAPAFSLISDLLAATSFRPQWMQVPSSWVGHLPFASWVIGAFPVRVFVELGTHTGNSYFGFCQAVKEKNLATRCFAVDTWQGDSQAGFYQNEVFEIVSAHNEKTYPDFSVLLRKTFDDALADLPDASVDLLHIDGLHTYEAVHHDFTTWLPKLAPGAIVLFHDICEKSEGFGAWKFWEELKRSYPRHLAFEQSHGLGVLQVGVSPSNADFSWLIPDSPESIAINKYFTTLGIELLNARSVEELQTRVAELEQYITGLSGSSELAAKTIEIMKNSWSWKLTAPCRWLQHALGGK